MASAEQSSTGCRHIWQAIGIRHGGAQSVDEDVVFGVPQGLVFGPLLFLLYTADLEKLIMAHQLHPHTYADDTQVYGRRQPADATTLLPDISTYVTDVRTWMQSNRLLLNADKTELI